LEHVEPVLPVLEVAAREADHLLLLQMKSKVSF